MTSTQYLEQHPNAQVKCSRTRERYSRQNKKNGDWIERRKAAGDDLSDYLEKMGKAVSDVIISNPEERQRRARQMAKNNRTPEARQRSRETAIKTSARPEIQRARAERLRRWREENFEEFYEKCLKSMHDCWHSKPERVLREFLIQNESSFKGGQRLFDTCFTSKSRRKLLDVFSKELGIIVEFDGKIHFEPIRGHEVLENTQKRDRELDQAVERQLLTLIRISYDQFIYGKQEDGSPGRFRDECIRQLLEHLHDPQPGVYRIGKAYNRGG